MSPFYSRTRMNPREPEKELEGKRNSNFKILIFIFSQCGDSSGNAPKNGSQKHEGKRRNLIFRLRPSSFIFQGKAGCLRQHSCASRVAALQYAVRFATLKRTDIKGIKYSLKNAFETAFEFLLQQSSANFQGKAGCLRHPVRAPGPEKQPEKMVFPESPH